MICMQFSECLAIFSRGKGVKMCICYVVFRQGNLSTDDFNKILNATSSHTHEMDVVSDNNIYLVIKC